MKSTHDFERIIGSSDAMQQVIEKARRAAAVDSPVLITGEPGTGKKLIAASTHRQSCRGEGPFVTVDLAAISTHIMEDELFGHCKGACWEATGLGAERGIAGRARIAEEARIGRLEAANGGTVFINEIGNLTATCQAKLLRLLENQLLNPLGSNEERPVDIRVMAATARPVETRVAQKQFRDDLLYRLNVIQISLPPLRQRPQDIMPLVHYFLAQFAEDMDRNLPEVDEPLQRYLVRHSWPGNVRQLRHCLESMFVLAPHHRLTVSDLPDSLSAVPAAKRDRIFVPADMTLEELEKAAIQQTLDRCDGNRTRAAETLGISVRTLQRKLRAWGS